CTSGSSSCPRSAAALLGASHRFPTPGRHLGAVAARFPKPAAMSRRLRAARPTLIWLAMRIPFLSPRRPVVSVIRLQGAIGAAARAGAIGLSDAGLAPLLNRAFRRRRPAAVAIALNSPGGSPVQTSLIAARIRRLAERHQVPVHVFVEDVAASGGYWLATAA